MLNLREYRHRADRLADHLPWAGLVADGVVLNKDGSFQRTLAFRGPDLESATEAELISACARANNVLKRFGTGWALFFEAERRESQGYPDSAFPDAASWLLDEERRAEFEGEGEHYESRFHLTLVWLPPADSSDAAGPVACGASRCPCRPRLAQRARIFRRRNRSRARPVRRLHARDARALLG